MTSSGDVVEINEVTYGVSIACNDPCITELAGVVSSPWKSPHNNPQARRDTRAS